MDRQIAGWRERERDIGKWNDLTADCPAEYPEALTHFHWVTLWSGHCVIEILSL